MTKQDALKFRYRLGNLEARMTSTFLSDLPTPENYTIDIVHLNNDGTHYSVAFFRSNARKSEWSLTYVGNRPLTEDQEIFRKLFEISYELLNQMYYMKEAERREE